MTVPRADIYNGIHGGADSAFSERDTPEKSTIGQMASDTAKPSAAAAAAFSAAQIAAAMGITPQAVRKALLGTPAVGSRIIGGNEATVWAIARLPEALRSRLLQEARRRGFRDAEAMLSEPLKQWEPPLPLREVAETDIEHATKLRKALLPWLLQQHDPNVASAEMEAQGVTDYARVFGHTITPRYWRELFMRTLRRDGGAENWGRLEIYLPLKLSAKEQPARPVLEALAAEFGDLAGYIDSCQRPPTAIEERGIWARAFEQYDRLAASGMAGKKAARRVRDLLFSKAVFPGQSRDALFKAFQRKLAAWKNKGVGALVDGRKDNGGDDFQFPQQDLDLVEAKIVFHYGAYAPAWREALVKGELSEETRAHYRRLASRKSHVPQKLISILGKRPIWLYTLHRRRKDFNSLKAHFDTVYDGLHSLDCISADDVTLPVWFWYQPDPQRPAIVTRGQCLVFIDLVSKRILGWSLQPTKTYNALVIYTQTARVFAEKGMPKALLFEYGIWERSKIITGSAPFSITEVTQGLKEFGVDFFHADTPEGKWEIEQVMGLIQNLMEGEAGYCGRDERKDRPDWIKKQLAEVQGKENPVHPSKYFYSFEEWNARLAQIFTEYNATKQGGKLMRDRSPDQVYVENWNADDPPTRLGPELRCLLSHAKYEVVVGPNGVVIHSGNRVFKYFGPELQELVGYKVLVWFNPEFPDIAVITDMKRSNPISVPLHDGVPRLERLTNPNGTALAEACARREGQVGAIVARYNLLKDNFELPYRKNLVAARTLEFVKQVEQQRTTIEAAQSAAATRTRTTRNRAHKLGLPARILNDGPESDEGTALMLAAKRAHQERGEEPSAAKTYQLDPNKAFTPKPQTEGDTL